MSTAPAWLPKEYSTRYFIEMVTHPDINPIQQGIYCWLCNPNMFPDYHTAKVENWSVVVRYSKVSTWWIIITLEARGKRFFFKKVTTSTGNHVSTNRMTIILNYHERHTKGTGKECRCKIQVISVYNKIIVPYFAVKQPMPPASIWKKFSVLVL